MYQIIYHWQSFPKTHKAYVCASSHEGAIIALRAQWDTTGRMIVVDVRQAAEGLVIVVA